MLKASAARLTLLRETDSSEFLYVYDMGDDWAHHVQVLEFFAAEAGTRLPRFVGGQ